MVKSPPENAGGARDMGSVLASQDPWSRKRNLFSHSCLENAMEREAWQALVHGVTKTRQ